MDELYSVRMRAAQGGDHALGGYHVSGAERLVAKQDVSLVMAEMVKRAQSHERGEADFINVVVEKIEKEQVLSYPALPVTTIRTGDYVEGRAYACRLLCNMGISPAVAEQAVHLLTDPAREMRGAMMLDIRTGIRLEEDASRGVRASRMDADYKQRAEFARRLQAAGLPHEHTREALILATKVCHAPGIAAELCWSDDPGYTAGYVASQQYGYVRFPHLKPRGLARGGRVFFFDPQAGSYQQAVQYLEKQPVFVEPAQQITPPLSWEEFTRLLPLSY